MTKNTDIQLIQTILCDDVRQEANGKFLLIGVYTDTIIVNILPADIVLSIWMQFEIHIKNNFYLEFEISGDALHDSVRFPVEMGDEKVFNKKQIIPFVAKFLVKIKNEGGFSVKYRKKGDETWHIAKNVTLIKNLMLS